VPKSSPPDNDEERFPVLGYTWNEINSFRLFPVPVIRSALISERHLRRQIKPPTFSGFEAPAVFDSKQP
jgi:hypothetical protein